MLLSQGLLAMVLTLPAIIVGLVVHEYAHAQVADWYGDDTPRREGRLTLEPWAHLDPIGFLALLLAGFGWAKPVPIDPSRLRNPRWGVFWVAAAGPISNVILAGLSAIALVSLQRPNPSLAAVLQAMLVINVVLAVFNLIPVPPLDGSRVLAAVLPRDLRRSYVSLEPYGVPILLVLILTGFTDRIIGPPVEQLAHWLLAVARAVLGG